MTADIDRASAAIRPAGRLDLGMLAALHAACFMEAWDAAGFGALLAMPGAFGLIAEIDDAPQAFLLARRAGGEAEILSLCVVAAARRRGLGTALLLAGLERFGRDGVTRIILEVAETNGAARALYRSHGFFEVGRRRGYYRESGSRGAAALVLARTLPGGAAVDDGP